MKNKLFTLLLALLMIFLIACGGVQGDEPAAGDDPDAPVSSDDPTTGPETVDEMEGDLLIGAATVENIQINIMESFPVQVSVSVSGYLGDGCTELGDITTTREGNTFFVTITTERPADAICTQQLVGFEENVSLDVQGLPAGEYTVDVNGVTGAFTLDMDNALPGGETEDNSGIELPQEDLAELIRLTLERALIAQEIPDYALLADQEQIVLSTENFDSELAPEIAGHTLALLTPQEIQARADAEGDFPYLRFQDVTAVSENTARVSLGSTWAIGADSDMLYLSGGGFTIEYTRTADGWSGEVIEAWIS